MNSFEIRDPEIDIDAIKQKILANIAQRYGESGPPQMPTYDTPDSVWQNLQNGLSTLDKDWNLTQYSIRSNRTNLASAMTLFKKTLDTILKPYANIFLYKQADFNRNLVTVLHILCDKLSTIERLFQSINEREGRLETIFNERVAELNSKIDNLSAKMDQKTGELNSLLSDKFTSLDTKINNSEENVISGMEAGLRIALEEISNKMDSIACLMEKNQIQTEEKLSTNIESLLDLIENI